MASILPTGSSSVAMRVRPRQERAWSIVGSVIASSSAAFHWSRCRYTRPLAPSHLVDVAFAGLAAGPEGEQVRIPRECWGGVGKSLNVVRPGERGTAWRDCSGLACLAIRFSVGCVLIIRL